MSLLLHPTFKRQIYGVMGLPFDAVTMPQVVGIVQCAVRTRCRLFISTPNLNFVVAARRDSNLRRSILISDLSLPDGMPVVWVARLLGAPITERVSGAGLFEALQRASGPPIRVYFFGGPDGVAAEACERINLTEGGLQCVGAYSPGFGSVDEMSSTRIIEQINAAEPDFLVVSLGAAKGQAWIERNLPSLNASVVSHLGAVVNFVAGRVKRAPLWVQRLGAEWAWRIKEEPALAWRYASDAWAFCGILLREVIPCALFARQSGRAESLDWFDVSRGGDSEPVVRLAPASDIDFAQGQNSADMALSRARSSGQVLRVDLDCLRRVDPQIAGQIMRLVGAAITSGASVRFVANHTAVMSRLRRWCAIPEVEAP